jgi:hypothetical protein
MNRVKLLIGIFVLLLLLACDLVSQPLPATPIPTVPADVTAGCADTHPTQRDLDIALQHSEGYFMTPTWERSYTVLEYQVRVTWNSDEYGAVANFDHVIFCDVSDPVLDAYYTPATLDIIMKNYDEHELQKECRLNGLRLYEFQAKKYGTDYLARLWAEIVDNNHTLQSLLVFPSEDQTNLDLYSRQIVPELSSCE